ncbi:hypothetical protein ASG22_08100 [Chryseobacterium sp. Leaf405]|nr:hypothetical protein ASG22_08100 [Chryseobacterium sp. Leaf405]
MKQNYGNIPDNAYYKDTDNFLDNFVGTWKYQNGNEELTMIIKKKLFYDYEGSYSDILYGEYKYINPSGNTLINTLNKIDVPMNESYHAISDALFIRNNQYFKCTDCSSGEFRVKSFFSDPDRKHITMNIIFRYINPTTIKARIYSTGVVHLSASDVNLPDKPQIPEVEYTMTKQ